MFYRLATNKAFEADRNDLLTKARSYIDISKHYCDKGRSDFSPVSFILGEAGVLVVAALVYAEMGNHTPNFYLYFHRYSLKC